jgi:hypothetical protein
MTYSIAQIRKLGAFALLLVIFATGCSHSRSAARRAEIEKPKPPPPPEAWIQAKSFAVLPLTKPELPPTAGQLAASITDAWRGAIQLKDPTALVTILGGRYPAIDTLRVDLSGASVIPTTKKPAGKSAEPKPTGEAVAVEHFALLADPMTSRKSKINLQITGEHVRLEVQRDPAGRSYLMMADARSGTLHFDVSMADLEKMMLAMAKESASKHAITVRSVRLNFVSVGPRSVNVELHVSTLIGFIPAGLRFTARVDVDDQMNARIWSLDVDGDEVLGPLISHFLRPSLAKYNGKTKRLIGFPNEAVRLKDVRIHAGERFTLTAMFGR